ncbi:helix-turn-helix transcriptional regulator [Tenggerimyces flavus]|uniref:Helix-turn-helix transcriptional regulator n=1 Tax=Tenggerimyces flavus TaxID=1708749 RepID=A0ABV7Y289_9ACTN|nr:YafY family protein [Tenggerimyces flavus]MBM7790788.1 putative DNA-binding transcriptional regulator YafY [Tenggerimyces flavus]
MRAERLLRIVMVLQAKGRATAAELGRELEVSPRTIQRDMDVLSGVGIPVYATRGTAGGWALVADYRTSLNALTTSDALAMVVAQSRGVLDDLGIDDPGQAPIHKLLAAIAPSARDQVEHARQRIHVTQGSWGPEPPRSTLLDLQRAIWADRLVSIRYRTSSPVTLELAPLGLVRDNMTWYLVGRREAGLRTYRVDRIRSIAVLDETFERPEGFDLAAHWQAASASYVQSLGSYVVRLRLRGDAVQRTDWVYVRSRTLSEPDADGWVDAVLEVGDEDNAHAVLHDLGIAGEVIVVEPESLRQHAVTAAKAFVAANDLSD